MWFPGLLGGNYFGAHSAFREQTFYSNGLKDMSDGVKSFRKPPEGVFGVLYIRRTHTNKTHV